MSTQTVSVPTYGARNDNRFGPAKIEHRTAGSGLYQLGSYFMVYDAEDHGDPWTVQYEETIYVIEGQSRLLIITGDSEQEVIGTPGDLIAIPQGTTLATGPRWALACFCPSRLSTGANPRSTTAPRGRRSPSRKGRFLHNPQEREQLSTHQQRNHKIGARWPN
jgi:hypothetical protein